MAVILVVEENGKKNAFELLRSGLIAGRNSSCKIVLSDELCSGEHCKFLLMQNGQAQVMDLGSTNGIAINSSVTRISKLFIGDVVNMGQASAWLEPKKMTSLEREIHTKEGIGRKVVPHAQEIELPKPKHTKDAKPPGLGILGPGKPKNKEDRTSTAVRSVRKARQSIKKK